MYRETYLTIICLFSILFSPDSYIGAKITQTDANLMEHFVVSARKYRPQTFKDVVGQQAITNTLLNAIENNHLAQATFELGAKNSIASMKLPHFFTI